jgi:hypothetical protein
VKADKAQLRRIAEELVGPLVNELREEHRQAVKKLEEAQAAAQGATEALRAERSRAEAWGQGIDQKSGYVQREIETFRKQVAGLAILPMQLSEAREEIDAKLASGFADLETRVNQIRDERQEVSEFERQVLASWSDMDSGLRRAVRDAEQALHEKGKAEQDAVSAAGKHAAEVAESMRKEAKRAESSVKSIARGVMRKLEKAGG